MDELPEQPAIFCFVFDPAHFCQVEKSCRNGFARTAPDMKEHFRLPIARGMTATWISAIWKIISLVFSKRSCRTTDYPIKAHRPSKFQTEAIADRA